LRIVSTGLDALKPARGNQLLDYGEGVFSVSEGSGAILLELSQPYGLARPAVDDEIEESLGRTRVGIGRRNDGAQQWASRDGVELLFLFRRLD
jgi:hypothetical protein